MGWNASSLHPGAPTRQIWPDPFFPLEPTAGTLRQPLPAERHPTYQGNKVYWIDVRGRRVVEPKDETKKRLGRSPDSADAALLAFANVGPTDERVMGRIVVP
jgi:hypothetical protein